MQMDGFAVGERGWSESGEEGDARLCLACESATMTATTFGSREWLRASDHEGVLDDHMHGWDRYRRQGFGWVGTKNEKARREGETHR